MPTITQTFNPALHEVQSFWSDEGETHSARFGANLTLAAGTVVAQNSSDGRFYAYAPGGANGLGTARGILAKSIKTDANGKATFGDQSPGEFGQAVSNVPWFWRGVFRKGDLGANLDAAAIAQLGARFLTGGTNPADDLLRIP